MVSLVKNSENEMNWFQLYPILGDQINKRSVYLFDIPQFLHTFSLISGCSVTSTFKVMVTFCSPWFIVLLYYSLCQIGEIS